VGKSCLLLRFAVRREGVRFRRARACDARGGREGGAAGPATAPAVERVGWRSLAEARAAPEAGAARARRATPRRRPSSLPHQDDTYTESYISTIGVDFVRRERGGAEAGARPRARARPPLVPLPRRQKIRTVELDGKVVKLQIVRGRGGGRRRAGGGPPAPNPHPPPPPPPHGGIANDAKVELVFIDSEKLEEEAYVEELFQVDAILVPGGFGKRGIEGMIKAIEFARGHKIPYLGICLGLQTAVIEFARNACSLDRANSSEFASDPPYKVIYKMRELIGVDTMGGTMRLGKYACQLKPGSHAWQAYKADTVWERHRHRYEVNPDYVPILEQHGMFVTGRSPDRTFVEMIEIPDHPWFVACQFHPELKSKPFAPHPLFVAFVTAALEHQSRREKTESERVAAEELAGQPVEGKREH